MKTYLLLALTIVLTAALFTGCGCTSQDAMYTTTPTTRPTTAPTAPSTQATTMPTTEAATRPTADHGNGSLEDTTEATTDSTGTMPTQEGRSRQMQPTIKQQ